MIKLFSTLYAEKSNERRIELEQAAKMNVKCSYIDKIFYLCENENLNFIDAEKINIIYINKRPTFKDVFLFINENTADDDINIIANTDIYFDYHLKHLEYCNLENTIIALTRWDVELDNSVKFFNKYYSQDSWIFKGKMNINIKADYFIGQYGCDNKLAYEFAKTGYNIINPSYSIKTYHLHNSGVRSYLNDSDCAIERPYYFLLPNVIDNKFRRIYYYFSNKERYNLSIGYRKLSRSIRYDFYKFSLVEVFKKHKVNLFNILYFSINCVYYYHYISKLINVLNEMKQIISKKNESI